MTPDERQNLVDSVWECIVSNGDEGSTAWAERIVRDVIEPLLSQAAHLAFTLRAEITSRNAANVELHEELDYARGERQDAQDTRDTLREELDTLRKRLALRMLENHAEAHLKDDPNTPKDSAGAIDWASVDWATVLTTLLKIFVAILALLLV